MDKYRKVTFTVLIIIASIFLMMRYTSLARSLEDSLKNTMTQCRGSDMRQCYRVAADKLLQRFTLSEILKALETHQLEPEFFSSCHLFSHYLGQAAYRQTHNIREILSETNPGCFNGALHGAVEGYFMENPEKINLENMDGIADEMRKLCGNESDYPNKRYFDTCYHGLGHATMFIVSNNLPLALKLCDTATTNRDLRYRCYAGAFMANIQSANDEDHPTNYFKKDDPLFPCLSLQKSHQEACYRLGVLGSIQGDVERSIKTCYRVPKQYQLGCFKMFGRDRVMRVSDPTQIKDICNKIGSVRFTSVCMQEAAHQLLERLGINSSLPFEVCRLVNPQDQRDCFSKLGNGLKSFTRDIKTIEIICNMEAFSYEKDCVSAQ